MSRPAMERALGKLVMDVDFRDAFARDPIEANRAAGSTSPTASVAPWRRYLMVLWPLSDGISMGYGLDVGRRKA